MSLLSNAFLKYTDEKIFFRRRMILIYFILMMLSISLFSRIFYLQVIQHALYVHLAQQNYEDFSWIKPIRGLIFDRNGVLLANNTPQINLVLIPNQVSNIKVLLDTLTKIISLNQKEVHHITTKFLKARKRRTMNSLVVRRNLLEKELAVFELNRYQLPGIKTEIHWSRNYPTGDLLSSVIGYMGRVSPQERYLEQNTFYYNNHDLYGKAGVEQYYESQLRGTQGYQQFVKDTSKKTLNNLSTSLPTNGNNLYLTIDVRLQTIVKNALDNQRGSVVVMNPTNGEILALVNNPTFDPPQTDLKTKASVRKPISFYNRALRGSYPPGSIVKPFIGLGALKKGIVQPDDKIYDSGQFRLNPTGKVYRNIYNIAWGNTNLHKAISVSSDIYFYQLSLKMGVDRLEETLRSFGYGQLTHIDLPNEGSGLLKTKQWKKETYGEDWYFGDTLNMGIGQGFLLATPLQMAVATSTLCMSGKRYKPHVLLGTQTPGGNIQVSSVQKLPTLHAPLSVWDYIQNAMANVVLEGSAKNAFKDVTYTLGGKTGTAQVYSLKPGELYDPKTVPEHLRDHSLFITFTPVKQPKIVMAIVLENSQIPAAYLARKILDAYFEKEIKS